MAHKVVFLRRAESRLAELALYIASEAGPAIANGYLDRIYAACMAPAEFPERRRSREDILPGLRTITMERRVTIAYRVRKNASRNRNHRLRRPGFRGRTPRTEIGHGLAGCNCLQSRALDGD